MTVKRVLEMARQDNNLDNGPLLDLQNRFAKALKKPLGWEKEKKKRDQILQEHLNELKSKIVRNKRKGYKVG